MWVQVSAWTTAALLVIGVIGSAGADEAEQTTAAGETTERSTEGESETTERETTTTERETTTTRAPTTTTTTLPIVKSGVYAVPAEFAPGTYRVSGYWARLDAAQEIIDNDIARDGLMLLDVQPTDAFVEINGEAIALADMPVVDPIAMGFTDGTYVVGVDIAPGQYRVTPGPSGNAYWARLDGGHEIIDNNFSEGQLIVVVQEGDYALSYSGTLEVMP
jgi:hypothetical protein